MGAAGTQELKTAGLHGVVIWKAFAGGLYGGYVRDDGFEEAYSSLVEFQEASKGNWNGGRLA